VVISLQLCNHHDVNVQHRLEQSCRNQSVTVCPTTLCTGVLEEISELCWKNVFTIQSVLKVGCCRNGCGKRFQKSLVGMTQWRNIGLSSVLHITHLYSRAEGLFVSPYTFTTFVHLVRSVWKLSCFSSRRQKQTVAWDKTVFDWRTI